tara:strand:+ start:51 stop:452 length:402 start_codon:yes stop_codon:yes gene_type:complete
MSNTRDALINVFNKGTDIDNNNNESPIEPEFLDINNDNDNDNDNAEEDKKRVGRPPVIYQVTKIHLILESRKLTRTDLYRLIVNKYPDEPMSQSSVCNIVSGKRRYYSTPTLFRICGALGVTPNKVLNYEEEV